MQNQRVSDVRAYVSNVAERGADYHAQERGHWIVDTLIANPMSGYPAYHGSRRSWGIDALGSFVVEIETVSGEVGVGISRGGEAGAAILNHHLRRFLLGADPRRVELIWDQLWRASLAYGRKGLAICVISAIDLALWDLCGKLRQEPVYLLLGGPTKDELPCYATGIKPARYKELGFFGAKLPLPHGPADGRAGLQANVELVAQAREAVGPDFDLMLDCYMALDVPYTVELAEVLRPYRVRWIEEPLLPDDYDGYTRLKAAVPWQRFTTGEHEYTRYGFRELIRRQCLDILQPDLTWVGGVTEARRIAAMASAYDIPVVPHGSGVFSLHFQLAFPNTPFAEFVILSPDGMEATPTFGGLLEGEPLPVNGKLGLPDKPGWGVTLDTSRLRLVTSEDGAG